MINFLDMVSTFHAAEFDCEFLVLKSASNVEVCESAFFTFFRYIDGFDLLTAWVHDFFCI